MHYWNREAECVDRDELRKLQSERLVTTIRHSYENVPAYKHKFDKIGLKPDDIKGIEDLVKIPFTVKTDFRDNYPFGMFAVPMDRIVRIHASSGTTGKSTVVGYTSGDVETWAELMARTLGAGGTTKGDIVQNAYGYGLFTGGLGAHYGAERIGASVIPISGGNTKRQLQIMEDFHSTVLCCTPSYALMLGESARDAQVNMKKSSLRVAFLGAEPWTENMRREIESALCVDALDIYGLSEVMGPGVSYECMEKGGLHINEDHFIAEIINPDTGEVLPPGSHGELVFTSLTKEALPLLRYRTRDITYIDDSPCGCGRSFARMHRVMGRSDDMLIIRGVNVFPSQIESVLIETEGTEPHYLIVVDRAPGKMDEMEVWVEVSPELVSDAVRTLESLERRIAHELHSVLGISVKVKLVEPKTIARSEGKAKRVIDRRELNNES
ncbi:MAG: phenylacetate--CoA ligase [Armatimonadetes bacterium]|jgi:phenylacetate-CoA ligase|nr:phenylacetate--CoA ligase [Armatimonadota bacterium]